MSDSEDSTVTYTMVSSPFGGLSDIRSPGVDGPPVMPEDPYAYVVATFQAPPSLDYVPGPEEPEQAPLLPEFVPEPVYPKFMPPKDDVLPAEEQPLPAAVSPIADSLGYIPESDPEEDPEENDDEDPEEDPTDYPTNSDDENDDDDEEEPSRDEADDEEEDKDDEEEEEEEYPASADFIPPPVHRVIARISIRAQTPVSLPSDSEVARLLAIPTPPPLPLSPCPTYPLGYRAAMIRRRAETPSTSHPLLSSMLPSGTPPLLPIPLPTPSPPLILPSTNYRAGVSEVTLPPQKRLCIALGLRYEVGESSSAPIARPTRGFIAAYGFVATLDDEIRRDPKREVGYGITDTWDEMLMGIPGALVTDEIELGRRLTNFITTREARLSREAWGMSMDASDLARSETQVTALQSQLGPASGPALPEIPEEAGTGVRRQAPPSRECTYPDFMKCTTLYFKGTEGVIELTQWFERMETVFRISNCYVKNQIKFATCNLLGSTLTWWNSHVKTVGHDVKGIDVVGYNQRFQELALMCARMFPEESDKIKNYDAIEFATELMDKKIHTFAERQSENKRKQDDNQQQQQQNKRQNIGRAYAVGSGEKKPYGGSKPLRSKCNYHHDSQCSPKCHKCNRVGHQARDCRSTANANTTNNQRGTGVGQKPTCYECGAQGHFKRDCPKLKNNSRGNQGGNGNAPAKVYAVGHAGTNPDSNIVTGTFLLNNRYASVLFDTGADRSFVSTAFSSQIDITSSP
ncbi:putative reverse transcriptase domain-containing protein [Tanacetum coccineum]